MKAFHLDCLATLVRVGSVTVGFETACALLAEGTIRWGAFAANDIVNLEGTDLTDKGRTLGSERQAKKDAKRAEQKKANRARNEAMRSLGMTRTRYGWE